MNHALYGATLPLVIGLVLYLTQGRRAGWRMLILLPLSMTFMAIWASAPDIPRVLGFQTLYLKLSFDPRIDIFLWHYTIDQLETSPHWYSILESDSSWFAVGLALEAAILMGIAIRELYRKEPS